MQLGADVQDDYRSLADLFGSATLDWVITEGLIQAQDAGITMRFGDRRKPAQAERGTAFASGGGFGVGPTSKEAGWPLKSIWVRRTDAGTPAFVTCSGVVE